MISLWSDTERLNKLMKAVQKWTEFHSAHDADIPAEIVQKAFEQGKDNAYAIIQEFDITNEETAGYLQSWVELGLFAGFLVGWKAFPSLEKLTFAMADFHLTKGIEDRARTFALELTDNIFTKLFEKPVSLLVDGVDEKLIRLLKVCYESSLYAGFLSGVEAAFNESGIKKFDPFDTKKILS